MSFKHAFVNLWQEPQRRSRVLGEYAAIGAQFQYFLTDVAARNFVFSEKPAARDLYEAGKFEGRRELALELVKYCNATFDELHALIERPDHNPKKDTRT